MSAAKQPKSRGSHQEVIKKEDVVQAIVIADSFNVRFAPLTRLKPRVLLPLVNCPIIEYTLGFLDASGVQIAYIFCSTHADLIKDYVKSSRWSNSQSGMQVVVIISESCPSLGDALREIDAKALVLSDFILVSGDLIGNVELKPLLEQHRELCKKDKTAAMTLVYKRAAPRHRTRSLEEETVLVTEKSSQRILHHQIVGSQKKISFPLTIFDEHSDISIRHDLLDCQISICSAQVLPLFSDNFDYQSRDDFVKGLLEHEEILGHTIHLHVLEDQYAARVSNLHMYDAVSKDIISRWVYPVVPDADVFGMKSRYSFLRNNVYLQKDITLARDSVFEENVVIGEGTKIGSNSVIVRTVIGRNCVIGDNVTIDNAYIWDGVSIGNNCNITWSILADGVHLKNDVKVLPRCILSTNVVVGPSVSLPEGTMLTAEPSDLDDFGDDHHVQDSGADPAVIGSEGKAFLYKIPSDAEDVKDLTSDMWGFCLNSEDDELSSAEISNVDDASDRESPLVDDSKLFYKEVLDSLIRGVEEKINCENLVLEINSSKYAYNVTMQEVNMLVIKAVLEIPVVKSKHPLQPQEFLAALIPLLKQLLPLFKNYMKSAESQIDCLNSLADYSVMNPNFSPLLMKILNMLYNHNVITEEAVLKWYSQPVNPEDTTSHLAIRNQVLPFVKWLQEAEEESDSSGDD